MCEFCSKLTRTTTERHRRLSGVLSVKFEQVNTGLENYVSGKFLLSKINVISQIFKFACAHNLPR